jgi:hypothetical protein
VASPNRGFDVLTAMGEAAQNGASWHHSRHLRCPAARPHRGIDLTAIRTLRTGFIQRRETVNRQFRKRLVIPVAVALVAIIAVSGIAYAYWTASGSGTGTGSTDPGVSDLTVHGAALSAMYPGDSSQTTSVTITNNATASAHVTSVSISGLTTSAGASCDSSNFSIGGPVAVPAGSQNIAHGASVTVNGPTIQFNNLPTNQDLCKNVTVTVTYSVSGT